MTEQDKLGGDIDGLKEAIRVNAIELAKKNLPQREHLVISQRTRLLIDEYKGLVSRLEKLDA